MNRALMFSIPLAAFAFGTAQTVQITGRIIERAAMDPVPGATVRLKGYNLTATTDSAGRFTLSGNPVSLQPRRLEWKTQLMEHGLLRVHVLAGQTHVSTALFDTQGKKIATNTLFFIKNSISTFKIIPLHISHIYLLNNFIYYKLNIIIFILQFTSREAVRYVRRNAGVPEFDASQALQQTVTFHKRK